MTLVKIALAASVVFAVSANAAPVFANAQPYVGVKVGQMEYKGKDSFHLTSYGVNAGYQFDANVGGELEFVTTEDKKVGDGKLSGKHYGVYGHYRYNFEQAPVYAKGRIGLVNTEVKFRAPTPDGEAQYNANKTGVAFGANLGYQATPNLAVDVGYTRYPKASHDNLRTKAQGWALGATYAF